MEPNPGPQDELVAHLKEGHGDSYERLLALHGPYLLRLARSILPNEQEAADAVQEAFLAIFQKVAHFRGDAQLRTWLHRVVVNVCLMSLRRRRRKTEVPVEFLEGCFASGPSALDELERRHIRRRVRAAVDRLPESYRAVLDLCYFEEMEVDHVTHRLGISGNAVRVRLCRARRELRRLLTADSAHAAA